MKTDSRSCTYFTAADLSAAMELTDMPNFEDDGPDQWQAIGNGWDCSIWTSSTRVQGRIAFGPFRKHVEIQVPFDSGLPATRAQAQAEVKGIASKIVAALGLER